MKAFVLFARSLISLWRKKILLSSVVSKKTGHKQTFQKEISDTTPKPPQIDLGVLLMASRPPPDNTSQKTLSGIKNAN